MKRKVSWKTLFSWQILYKCILIWNCSVIEIINENKTLDFKIGPFYDAREFNLFEFYTNVKWMECGFSFTPVWFKEQVFYSPLFGLRKVPVVAGGPLVGSAYLSDILPD